MTATFALLRAGMSRLWRADRTLTAVGLLMLGTLLAALAGMALDPRTIGGAPAWLKPAKFGLSTAVYSLTLAWVFERLPDWPRVRRAVSWTTAVVFTLEVAIIDVQAWRGTTSHFNVATLLDAVLFAVMGIAIAAQTLASASVAYALWHQPIADRTMGAALRAGMLITLIGASTGGLMTTPTSAQLREARATNQMAVSGAHTVGAPDGGAGLPGVGWSREHGDLRIPHFLGLHALQFLPLLAVVLGRRGRTAASVRMMRALAASYAALFAVLLVQALRGEALVAPSLTTTVLLGGWIIGTTVALLVTAPRRDTDLSPSAMTEA